MGFHWTIGASQNSLGVIQGPGATAGALKDLAVDATTPANFTLTPWQGRMIAVTLTADAFYRWAEATGDAFDATAENVDANTAAANISYVGRLPAGRHFLTVPRTDDTATAERAVILKVRAVTGTVDVYVEQS